jgi:hypothetical protein
MTWRRYDMAAALARLAKSGVWDKLHQLLEKLQAVLGVLDWPVAK